VVGVVVAAAVVVVADVVVVVTCAAVVVVVSVGPMDVVVASPDVDEQAVAKSRTVATDATVLIDITTPSLHTSAASARTR
jgi:hypothetical protein